MLTYYRILPRRVTESPHWIVLLSTINSAMSVMPFLSKLVAWNLSGFACMLFSSNQCKMATRDVLIHKHCVPDEGHHIFTVLAGHQPLTFSYNDIFLEIQPQEVALFHHFLTSTVCTWLKMNENHKDRRQRRK